MIKRHTKLNVFINKKGKILTKKVALPAQIYKDENFPFRDNELLVVKMLKNKLIIEGTGLKVPLRIS